MLKNYLKIAFRNLRRDKLYSFINIGGLAIGLAVCLLIFLYIQYEFSYDIFNEKRDRIYRVNEQISHNFAKSPDFIAPVLKAEIPGIQEAARMVPMKSYLSQFAYGIQYSYRKKRFYVNKGYFVDPSIFKIFTIQTLKGVPQKGLSHPNTIFLSESMEKKFFGEGNAIGKTIRIANSLDYEITGVFKDFSPNSHIHANFLASIASIAKHTSTHSTWSQNAYTYLLLKEESKSSLIKRQISNYVQQNAPLIQGKKVSLSLMPLLSIHLYSKLLEEPEAQGDILYIYLFGAIALLILTIACFNYVNMSTARSTEKSIEIGIRKATGAGRIQIVCRFFCETVLLNLIALILAVGLVELLLPYFDRIIQLPISFKYINQFWILGFLGFVLLSVSVIGGSYSAIYLSSFHPATVLKGGVIHRSGTSLRKVLTVIQFVISVAMIICTILLRDQMIFVQDRRPGGRISHIVMIKNHGIKQKNYRSFKAELLRDPAIQSVTTTANISGIHDWISFNPEDIEGYNQKAVLVQFLGDADFISTFGLKIIKGRDFAKNRPSDKDHALIVNEATVKKFGWKDPIGKRLRFKVAIFKNGKFKGYSYQNRVVIGLVKDFHNKSLRKKVEPTIIELTNSPNNYIAVRMGNSNIEKTISFINMKWSSFVPAHPFDYTFLSDVFNAMYRSDYLLGRIFKAFTFFAIIIACLGLFGLTAYSAERRTKEIGIRKVLGASVTGIIVLLYKDFLKLVGIGFLIAIPIAWYAIHRWLQNFVYHIHIGVWTFVLTGILTIVITLVTVSWQSLRAATINPVECLRTE